MGIYFWGGVGGVKLSEIEENSQITLLVKNKDNSMEINGSVIRHVRENIALISLDYDTTQRLIFEGVKIDMEYCHENEVPYIWRNVKIVNYKHDYILQVFSDGMKYNRRDSFRVGVSVLAEFRKGGRTQQVLIRDISVSGFAISDRKNELGLSKGDEVFVKFEDIGHYLDLAGRVVRIEEREDMIIYGLEICNLCKDLSSYVSIKQRRNNGHS